MPLAFYASNLVRLKLTTPLTLYTSNPLRL